MKKTPFYFCISVIAVILLLCGCAVQREQPRTAEYFDVLDTYCSIQIYGADDQAFADIDAAVHDELMRYDKLFDIYSSYDGINNIKTINDNAGIHSVAVDTDIIRLLQLGTDSYASTGGAVNIAMGSVLSIWHDYRDAALEGNAALPSDAELKAAAEHTSIDSIQIDQLNGTVYIADKYTSIDVGAIAKGYIADELKQLLTDMGVENALINLGGNIMTMGMAPDQDKWAIGVQNPENTSEYVDILNIDEGAVVTSGDYQRYYEYNGKRYCHIIDGSTLMPAERYKSVTICAQNAALADEMSTALFILPQDKGRELSEKYDFEAVWIMQDGTVERTAVSD